MRLPPHKAVLDTLQRVQVPPGHAGIAVDQPGADDSTSHGICSQLVHSPSYLQKLLYVKVCGLPDVPGVLVKRQWCVKALDVIQQSL